MEQTRAQVVTTTTTTEDSPLSPMPAITDNNPWASTTERVEQVSVDPYAAGRSALYSARQMIWLIFAFIEGMLAIRFVLRLLGANPDAGFAQLIYGITAPLVAPFVGLFGTPRFQGSAFEFTTLVAMIIYALLAWVFVKLMMLLFSETRSGMVTRRTDTRIQ